MSNIWCNRCRRLLATPWCPNCDRPGELTRQSLDTGFQAVEVALGPDGVRALVEERNTAQGRVRELEKELAQWEESQVSVDRAQQRRDMQVMESVRVPLEARIAELEARIRRCEDCDATMNHIGNGIFECWKCTEAETRAQLVEAQSLRKDVNDAFQTLRAAGLMAGVRPVTVSNLVAKLIAERDSLCGQVDDAVAQMVKANAGTAEKIAHDEAVRLYAETEGENAVLRVRAEKAEARATEVEREADDAVDLLTEKWREAEAVLAERIRFAAARLCERNAAIKQAEQAEAQAATLLPVTEASLKYFEALEKGASLGEQQRLWLLWDCAVIKYRAALAPETKEETNVLR